MTHVAQLVTCALAVCALVTNTQGEERNTPAPQIIILKLDDITTNNAAPGQPVSPRWQRVIHFLEESKLKASCGIIGYSLEADNEIYFQWIKDLHAKGNIEFWNHGYRNRQASDKTGEFEGSLEQQVKALRDTQRLAKQKLGITLTVFGPHWSPTNDQTGPALDAIPEIKAWFYGTPGASSKLAFERVLVLENPTFVPDFERFKELYEQHATQKECLALQGHPNAWDDQRWAGFVKIIEFLQSRGCVFMTPSEYVARQAMPR